jgi:hypothetical protein
MFNEQQQCNPKDELRLTKEELKQFKQLAGLPDSDLEAISERLFALANILYKCNRYEQS